MTEKRLTKEKYGDVVKLGHDFYNELDIWMRFVPIKIK